MSIARIMPWVVGMWLEYTLRCQPSLLSATFWVLRVPLNGGQTHAGFGTPKKCPDAKIMWTFFRDQILSPLNARVGRGGLLPYKRLTGKCRWMVRIFTTAIMDNSLGTLLRFWGRFPIHTGPIPPFTPQTMLDSCIHNFFWVSTLYRVKGGRTARKFQEECTV